MPADRPELPRDAFERAARFRGIAFLDGRIGVLRAPLSHIAWEPQHEVRVAPDGAVRIDARHVPSEPIAALEAFLESESSAGRTVIGALGYDLRCWLEPRSGRPRGQALPVAALASYDSCFTFDHARGAWRSPPPPLPAAAFGAVRVSGPRPTLDSLSYRRLFERVAEWIRAGDIYQANLSIGFDAELDGDAAALYERLGTRNPVPYGAYLDFGDFQILSNSPELFLERRGRRIATRPIKGTRPRGRGPEDDARLIEELRRDPKERAEHLMIVDLERSDLGRIAETASVSVEEFETVESYATLHHLESTVCARAPRALGLGSFLRAMFPGGSITGAPKIRAMQILEELEPDSRGFYTGAILHHPPNGDFTLSICIRTATVHGGRIRYAAGGGLVADSNADAEYAECLLKAQAFFAAARADGSA